MEILVLGFVVEHSLVMTRFRMWPREMVGEEETDSGKKIKELIISISGRSLSVMLSHWQ